jgi:RNA polymerase sigma-70 factor (ECF subfamily)
MTDSAVMEGPRDDELVAAFQAGDEQAFVVIVDRYKHRLTRLAHSVVHNEEDALDIVQEALIKVYKGLKRFRSSSTLYTWLYRVVMNHAIDKVRRRAKVVIESTSDMLYELPDSVDTTRPDKEALRAELHQKIFAAVDTLPEKQRTVVLLREVEGLSYKEIAQVTGCSEGTVMSRLYYGREQLRKLLEPYLQDGS